MDIIFTILIAFAVLVVLILIDFYFISKLDKKNVSMIWLALGIIATLNYMFVRFEIIDHIAPMVVAYSIFKLYRK